MLLVLLLICCCCACSVHFFGLARARCARGESFTFLLKKEERKMEQLHTLVPFHSACLLRKHWVGHTQGTKDLSQYSVLLSLRQSLRQVQNEQKKFDTPLDLCVSSLRRGHANLLCIVPILSDDPRRESSRKAFLATSTHFHPQAKIWVKGWVPKQGHISSSSCQHRCKYWVHACDFGIWKKEQVVLTRVMHVDGSPKPSR